MRKHGKKDATHDSIVAALREIGAHVQSLASVGNGVPDLLVSYRGAGVCVCGVWRGRGDKNLGEGNSQMTKKIKTIDDLTPDRANLNKGTERGRYLLETSVSKLGLGRSVLADKNGTLIAGNKTTEVAGELGIGKVRVIETDGTELIVVQRTDLDMTDPDDPRARQLAFADNQVGAQNLAWDAEALLAAAQADDLSDFVRDDELKAMIESAQEEESNTGGNSNVDAEPQIDKAEELRAKWGVETGQLWELGDHRLLCGDSTNKSEAEKVMGGGVG